MTKLSFTILGCGSSGGVPRLGGNWGDCDPNNIKNQRSRCSLLVERASAEGVTSVLIDTSPDMRSQLLKANVGRLDGVVYTHEHADHVHGIDDLRMIFFNMRKRIKVWADIKTQEALVQKFGYTFVQAEGSPYPPILKMSTIDGEFSISGLGGEIKFNPFEVQHGTITSLGFRVNDVAYIPDISEMNELAWAQIKKTKIWILDALRRTPHQSHTHLTQSLEWIKKSGVKKGILTNMHIDMDYETLLNELPGNIEPAYDGMKITSLYKAEKK
jgi:phosphoribosyl 1,2-cyclic phosphate phosphodiesterase